MPVELSECSDLQRELGKKVLINLPSIKYKTISSSHSHPSRVSPLVISKHSEKAGMSGSYRRRPRCSCLQRKKNWAVNTSPRLFLWFFFFFSLTTTLTIKKNSSGIFPFFPVESLLFLPGITWKIEELLSIKNWCGMECKGESKGNLQRVSNWSLVRNTNRALKAATLEL